MTQELGPNQRKWLAALRSGEYQQGKGQLCREQDDSDPKFCCLGVACMLFMKESSWKRNGSQKDMWLCAGLAGTAPKKVVEALGLKSSEGMDTWEDEDLAHLNDTGRSFKQIARLLESNPSRWFTAPK